MSTSMAIESVVELAAEADVACEHLAQRERVIVEVREAPGHARLAAEVVEVGDKPGGVIAEQSRAGRRAWARGRRAASSSRPTARGATVR